jgi:hypothetical protein
MLRRASALVAFAAFAAGGSVPVLHATAHALHESRVEHEGDHGHRHPGHEDAAGSHLALTLEHPDAHPEALHGLGSPATKVVSHLGAAAPVRSDPGLPVEPSAPCPAGRGTAALHSRGPPPGLPARAPPV